MKPPRSECALKRLEAGDGDAGHGNPVREDAAHRIGVEGRIADAVADADAAEERPGLPLRDSLPGVEGADGDRFRRGGHAAGRSRPPALLWSVLPRRMRSFRPPATSATSSTLERHELRAPQGAGEAEEQQRPIPPARAHSRHRSRAAGAECRA